MEKIWDPLRKREVALTPEEKVRQWLIAQLKDFASVPVHQMMSEVELEYSSGKVYRADLVIYGRAGIPLAIAECKRPEVELSTEVLQQVLRYNMMLNVPWLILSNGVSTLVWQLKDTGYTNLNHFPSYSEMLSNQ